MDAVLENHLSAPIEEPLRAMLTFLDKMTLRPTELSKADVAPLRALGLTNAHIREAAHISAMFNVYDRLADALGWEVPVDASFEGSAKFLLKNGYGL